LTARYVVRPAPQNCISHPWSPVCEIAEARGRWRGKDCVSSLVSPERSSLWKMRRGRSVSLCLSRSSGVTTCHHSQVPRRNWRRHERRAKIGRRNRARLEPARRLRERVFALALFHRAPGLDCPQDESSRPAPARGVFKEHAKENDEVAVAREEIGQPLPTLQGAWHP
jgi:hypothetical protein